ncbi:hypothetical protein [Peribacillus frigoritolerans]|uniref:hypothetical protein n=1 Tax=Peribacillus frigoritolerans TaxID=450367 RepID=UPI002E24A31C|nr:hypothetical protein [Peribacillus frigoritolerans]
MKRRGRTARGKRVPGVEVNVRVLQTKKHKKHGVLSIKTKLIGTEGTRLLREKRVQGRTPQALSVEGGPSAESESLEWKSTFEFHKQKKYRQHGVLSIKTKLIGTEGMRLLREKRV